MFAPLQEAVTRSMKSLSWSHEQVRDFTAAKTAIILAWPAPSKVAVGSIMEQEARSTGHLSNFTARLTENS